MGDEECACAALLGRRFFSRCSHAFLNLEHHLLGVAQILQMTSELALAVVRRLGAWKKEFEKTEQRQRNANGDPWVSRKKKT